MFMIQFFNSIIMMYFRMSPTHPSMIPPPIAPVSGMSRAGTSSQQRIPLRGGPMGRGDYGKYFSYKYY